MVVFRIARFFLSRKNGTASRNRIRKAANTAPAPAGRYPSAPPPLPDNDPV
jgi:hypothetical protein